jgi:RNase H-like domain found in reverse transcriptase
MLNYTLPFEIFCDTSKHQVSSIIAQQTERGLKPVAFLAVKMMPPQHHYTMTEQEICQWL